MRKRVRKKHKAEKPLKRAAKCVAKNAFKHCGHFGHDEDDCWQLEKNKTKCPAGYKPTTKKTKKKEVAQPMTMEEFQELLQALPSWQKSRQKNHWKVRKQKVHYLSDSAKTNDDDVQ